MRRVSVSVLALAMAACGGSSSPGKDDAPAQGSDAPVAIDAPPDADLTKAANCTGDFGTGLPPGFGRIDGTVLAVVPPGDEDCPAPNATHMILEIQKSDGVFRMVVDVLSNQGSPDVLLDEVDAPLAGDAWSDGWHTGQALDYATTLNVHSPAFVATPQRQLVDKITAEIEVGARISVFATVGSSEPDSAHLVHRNDPNEDGAIVIHPDTAPHYILLRFDEQLF